jgi:phosphonoacetaldehyde hydrolase
MQAILKVGDTIADIEEGLNAGMWSVGVVTSSNEMGMTQEEITLLSPEELMSRKKNVRNSFLEAGADYVIDDLSEIGELIHNINLKLSSSVNLRHKKFLSNDR